MKKYIYIAVAVVGACTPFISHATVYYDNTYYISTSTAFFGSIANVTRWDNIASGTVPFIPAGTPFELWVNTTSSNAGHVTLAICDSASWNLCFTNASPAIPVSNGIDQLVTATTSVNVSAGKYLIVGTDAGETNYVALRGEGTAIESSGGGGGNFDFDPGSGAFFCIADNLNECGAAPAPPLPVITLQTPANGTTTPNFYSWILQTPSSSLADISSGAYITVQYWQGTSSIPVNAVIDTRQVVGVVPNIANFSQLNATGSYTMLINKHAIPDFALYGSTSTWQTEIIYEPDNGHAYILATSTFNFNSSASTPLTCIGSLCTPAPGYQRSSAIVPNPTIPGAAVSVANLNCPSPSGPTDIGGGLSYAGCVIMNYMFVTDQSTWDNFNNAVINIQNAPPLVWFFGPVGSFVSSSTLEATTSDIGSNTQWNLDGSTSTYTFVKARWYDTDGVTFELIQAWFNLVLAVICFVIFLLLFKLIKK